MGEGSKKAGCSREGSLWFFIAALCLNIMSCMPIHCSWTETWVCLKGTEMPTANTVKPNYIYYEIRTSTY